MTPEQAVLAVAVLGAALPPVAQVCLRVYYSYRYAHRTIEFTDDATLYSRLSTRLELASDVFYWPRDIVQRLVRNAIYGAVVFTLTALAVVGALEVFA